MLAPDLVGELSCVHGLGAPITGDLIEPCCIAVSCVLAVVTDLEPSCTDKL